MRLLVCFETVLKPQYYEFTGLDTNPSYYLYFSKPLFSNATITGTGHIKNIK